MKIRKSTEQDIERIMEIYRHARQFMAAHGNPNQWGLTGWPPERLIRADIQEGSSYVCTNDAGTVIGTFYFVYGDDIEPTYRSITDGWTAAPTGSSTELPQTDRKKESVPSASTGLSNSAGII